MYNLVMNKITPKNYSSVRGYIASLEDDQTAKDPYERIEMIADK